MRAAILALSFLHNSREDGGKQGSSHFDRTPQCVSDTCGRKNCLEEPVFMVRPKHLLTELGIHQRLDGEL